MKKRDQPRRIAKRKGLLSLPRDLKKSIFATFVPVLASNKGGRQRRSILHIMAKKSPGALESGLLGSAIEPSQ